jgi:Tfp pilus assembly protein PilX
MIGRQNRKSKSSERGVALVIALLTLLLISAILMGMIVASNSETNISTNFRDEQTAFFAARAGIEEIRDRLRAGANPSLSTNSFFTAAPTAQAGQPSGVLYIINPANGETVAPWNLGGTNYPDDEICKEIPCTAGPNPLPTWNAAATANWYITPAPSSTGNSYAAVPPLTWKWVRVMQKPNKSDTGSTRITSVDGAVDNYLVCYNGTNEHVEGTGVTACPGLDRPVYELTSLAVTKSGSRRMVQYEISQTTLPPIPGAMVFDGATPNFGTNPNSAAFGVTGMDTHTGPNGGVGCPAASNEPALGGFDAASTTSLQGQVNRPGSYAGSPAGISNVSSQLGPLSTVAGLNALVSSITTMAGPNVYGPNPLPSPAGLNAGTNASPQINVVEGDYTMPGSGSGILLVTGTLTMNGNPSWNGLILVVGKGNIVKNGGGNGTLDGALLVANLYSDPPPTYTHLIASGPPGIPTIAWNGGGNATVQYDSCWLSFLSQSQPYRTITDRELIY